MGNNKRDNKKGVRIEGPFTPITNKTLDSTAYKKLTGNAAKIYGYIVRVARTVAHKIGTHSQYDVTFNYTYSEAKKRGFSESTFKRAIQELWKLGFIDVVEIGGRTASAERGRMSSKYKLSAKWETYDDGNGNGKWRDRTKIEPDPWKHPSEPKKSDTSNW